MPTQDSLDEVMLLVAGGFALLSKAKRQQVGAIIWNGETIIATGYNGTPSGFSNQCEDIKGTTLPHVLHAEANAIAKLARSTSSGKGATLYTTLSPCWECAKLIIQTGITRVVYQNTYHDKSGLTLLEKAKVTCELK